MRRIFGIIMLVLIVFLCAYIVFPAVQAPTNSFYENTVKPGANGIWVNMQNLYATSIAPAPMWPLVTLLFGLVIGGMFVMMRYKTDWAIWRWAQKRTSKRLGTTPVSDLPRTTSSSTTPPGATTRPESTPALQPTSQLVTEEKPKEEAT